MARKRPPTRYERSDFLKELGYRLRSRSGVTGRDLEVVLEEFENLVTQIIAKGDEINLLGFGKFYTSWYAARPGRNPKTGAPAAPVKARRVARFTAGTRLKQAAMTGTYVEPVHNRGGRPPNSARW